MIKRIRELIAAKDSRTRQIQINTVLNICFRGLGILCSFLIVPVTLSYINPSEYGVWLTLTSVVAWLSYMDVGLGNGLRNKLGEALAANDKALAKEYVSTTYIIFAGILGCFFLIFCGVNFFLNWNVILKTTISIQTLFLVTNVIVFAFCLKLLLNLAITVLIAMQKVFVDSLVNFVISLVTLLTLYILPKLHSSSFSIFSISFSIIPVVILTAFTLILFRLPAFKYLKPSFKYFRREQIKTLLNIGLQFFLIQFMGIIVFSTDNILITQFFSPADVTSFNVAYKYFSIVTMGFTIVLLPYWSAFTNAYFKKDIGWINSAFKKLLVLWGVQVVGVICLILCANYFFHIWVGNSVTIPFSLTIALGCYSVVFNWNNIFAYFINGVSKIRLQLYSASICGIINIPLSILLIKYSSLGITSIVVANTICLFVSSIWSPVQCYKIITNKATGIWNK
jgi:O-antigen/teichoic acid export membrane protein